MLFIELSNARYCVNVNAVTRRIDQGKFGLLRSSCAISHIEARVSPVIAM